MAREKRGDAATRRIEMGEGAGAPEAASPGAARAGAGRGQGAPRNREALWSERAEMEERLGELSLEMSGGLRQALAAVEKLRSRQGRLLEAEIRALRDEIHAGRQRLLAESEYGSRGGLEGGADFDDAFLADLKGEASFGSGDGGGADDGPMGALPPAGRGNGRPGSRDGGSRQGGSHPQIARSSGRSAAGAGRRRAAEASSWVAEDGGGQAGESWWTRPVVTLPGWAVALALAALLLFGGAAAWRTLRPGAGDDGERAASSREGAATETGGEAAASAASREQELRREILERLARPAVAGSLLRRAAAVPELEARAAETYLVLRFGAAGGVRDPLLGCGLLQTAINEARAGAGQERITVDGGCGEGTRRALAAVVNGGPCAGGDWQAQGACLLARAVRDDGRTTACEVRWPLVRACAWTRVEAGKLAALVSSAGAASSNARIREAAAELDLGKSPELSRSLEAPLDPAGAQLADLAVAVQRSRANAEGNRVFETLDAGELETLLAFLDAPEEGAAG